MLSKILVIGIIVLLVGASVVPSIGGEVLKHYNVTEEKTEDSQGNSEILFYDDFDDNTKDYDKWTEIFTYGMWWERNQRAEFRIHESGSERYEGIESSEITVSLSPNDPIIISCDMISDIGSTGWVGYTHLEVTDGTNWIVASYRKGTDDLQFQDSNDASWTILNGNYPDGTWNNEIQIFSDRYSVRMDTYESGLVYDTLFPLNSTLKVRIYVQVGGDYPDLYLQAGFDNVLVEGQGESAFKTSFILGKITNLNTEEDIITFEAVNIRCIQFFPFGFTPYTSGEIIVISEDYIGVLTLKFIFAVCEKV